MLPALELTEALADIPLTSEASRWTRAIGYRFVQASPPGSPEGSPPQPLWPGGPAKVGARFTPLDGFGSIYLASDPVTALYEVSAIFGEGTLRTPPWTVFGVEGFLQGVLDLTDSDIQNRLGTTLAELTGDWVLSQELHREGKGPLPPTQLLAKIAYNMETVVAIRYRSAKNIHTGVNVVVFSDRLVKDEASYLEVYDPHGLIRQRLP